MSNLLAMIIFISLKRDLFVGKEHKFFRLEKKVMNTENLIFAIYKSKS